MLVAGEETKKASAPGLGGGGGPTVVWEREGSERRAREAEGGRRRRTADGRGSRQREKKNVCHYKS